eukprot:CAMPEP_0179096110 /NCGR_PEP_ID=MMETSP0796-20121207/44163_1 /TAXON_ID=73915 /ORGANISM="Pyrodinium bahamense, Strain pbaha01" /LENGTH=52 /DNA_ID=CAMNT_0020793815 /DNA_START=137 /DNA_END=293 /DNA_ORIENTATION=-
MSRAPSHTAAKSDDARRPAACPGAAVLNSGGGDVAPSPGRDDARVCACERAL